MNKSQLSYFFNYISYHFSFSIDSRMHEFDQFRCLHFFTFSTLSERQCHDRYA